MTRIEVIQADITKLEVDAIVNAANEGLVHGGGVARAIAQAAGPDLWRECEVVAPVPTGTAKATAGYNLPAKWIIHAVGPVWNGGEQGEPEKLAGAYRTSIEVAAELGAKSIAVPCISTSIFGYPGELAAPIAIKSVEDALKNAPNIELVQFCTFTDEDYKIYKALLG